ncbi:MAG: hypothetical protein WED34_09835 [Planctomycetales bacterium]
MRVPEEAVAGNVKISLSIDWKDHEVAPSQSETRLVLDRTKAAEVESEAADLE